MAAINPEKIPTALLRGKLPIGEIELDCAVLDDGTRILTAASIFTAFNRSRKGQNNRLEIDGTRLPPFIAAKNLEPFIDQQFMEWTKLISYQDGSGKKSGYAASLVPQICRVYLNARRQNVLTESQQKVASQAEIIATALAQVGIDALVDEVTGYQKVRSSDALRLLLSKYIAEGLREWIKTFPDIFFSELDRLYKNSPTTSKSRPRYYGTFINSFVYNPIEHGYLKAELNKLNIDEEGKRRGRFHQWLKDEGRQMLGIQIGRVLGVMGMCKDIDQFKKAIRKQEDITIAPYMFDDMNQIIE